MQEEGTQFEILNRVDAGGMAEIFRAKNLANGEIVAIKRILPSLVGQDAFMRMFIDEAAICMKLRHPNIVRVDQVGLMGDALFMTMEFVDGTNLREILNFANKYQFRIPAHEAIKIAIDVLSGLDYAHNLRDDQGQELNLVHRDVSPPNILLGYNGDVKLADFGLARSRSQISHTIPGLIKGKFSYLSPETAYGESIDRRSDLYAVGIILWEMLAARPLFTDPNEMKILDLVRKSIIPPLQDFNPDVPDELNNIILHALARSRNDRYQTASEFSSDLKQFLDSIGNPPSDLPNIVSSIVPPKDETIDEPEPVPETLSQRSELIPIDVLLNEAEANPETLLTPKQDPKRPITSPNTQSRKRKLRSSKMIYIIAFSIILFMIIFTLIYCLK